MTYKGGSLGNRGKGRGLWASLPLLLPPDRNRGGGLCNIPKSTKLIHAIKWFKKFFVVELKPFFRLISRSPKDPTPTSESITLFALGPRVVPDRARVPDAKRGRPGAAIAARIPPPPSPFSLSFPSFSFLFSFFRFSIFHFLFLFFFSSPYFLLPLPPSPLLRSRMCAPNAARPCSAPARALPARAAHSRTPLERILRCLEGGE